MIAKKSVIIVFCIILLSFLVVAQEYHIGISVISEDKLIEQGKLIRLKVTLQDSNNKIIDDEISITLKDLRENIIKETTIRSNYIEEIELGKKVLAGEGEIIARYNGVETTESFFIVEDKLAKFELEGEKLIITNIGNTKYNKKIYITIGDETISRSPSINIGELISYRLIAPEGLYHIRVKEEGSTYPVLEKEGIGLTGKVIGIELDEAEIMKSPVTGGINPDENSEINILRNVKNSKFVYVFVLIVLGAMILLAIEKRSRGKISK
jgi:hypothetical protein